jgi:hypothetical protein
LIENSIDSVSAVGKRAIFALDDANPNGNHSNTEITPVSVERWTILLDGRGPATWP